jgi:hypothetical protein
MVTVFVLILILILIPLTVPVAPASAVTLAVAVAVSLSVAVPIAISVVSVPIAIPLTIPIPIAVALSLAVAVAITPITIAPIAVTPVAIGRSAGHTAVDARASAAAGRRPPRRAGRSSGRRRLHRLSARVTLIGFVGTGAGVAEPAAKSSRLPRLHGASALYVHNDTLIVDLAAVCLLIRPLHISLVLEFYKGISARAPLLVCDNDNLLHRAKLLEFSAEFAFCCVKTQSSNKESSIRIASSILIRVWIPFRCQLGQPFRMLLELLFLPSCL